MLKSRNLLQDQLIKHEGENLSAYEDSLGYLTIGVGHCIDARLGCKIPSYISRLLLQDKINEVIAELLEKLPWAEHLNDARLGALINMAYNLGIPRLLKFKLTLKFLREGKFKEASWEMLDSLWARQVGKRALDLSQQIRDDKWIL